MEELIRHLKSIKDIPCNRDDLVYVNSNQSSVGISPNKKVWILIVKSITSVEVAIQNGSKEKGTKSAIVYIHSDKNLLEQVKEAEEKTEEVIMKIVHELSESNKQNDRNFSVALKSMMYRKLYSRIAEIQTFGS